jgi:hypothetical protein
MRKSAFELLNQCNCTLIERYRLLCFHDLEQAFNEVIPLPLILVYSRWWYAAGIEARAGWRPSYGVA